MSHNNIGFLWQLSTYIDLYWKETENILWRWIDSVILGIKVPINHNVVDECGVHGWPSQLMDYILKDHLAQPTLTRILLVVTVSWNKLLLVAEPRFKDTWSSNSDGQNITLWRLGCSVEALVYTQTTCESMSVSQLYLGGTSTEQWVALVV